MEEYEATMALHHLADKRPDLAHQKADAVLVDFLRTNGFAMLAEKYEWLAAQHGHKA